jgi:hypothetical protein
MIRLTLTSTFTLSLLLFGIPSRAQAASGDTPITVKDGGSVLLHAEGLDDATKWKVLKTELRHGDPNGVLSGLQVTESGADRCAGNPTCGINATQPWKIRIVYNDRWITIASLSGNKGVHVKFSRLISFDQWKKTQNANEREFGHGDGHHITSIKLNGSATSLCAGKGNCEVTVLYRTP